MRQSVRPLIFGLFLFLAAPVQNALAGEITVSAAISLSNAFTEIKEVMAVKRPDIKISTNFAASGALLRQMEEGAPVDVFASADQETMNKAAGLNLLAPGSRADFASNSLVLIVPSGENSVVTGLESLSGPSVKRVAMGNPASVPAGRYAKQALEAAGLYKGLEGKLILGENVRQVLDYVSRGETQAGIVYMTDAKQAGEKVRVVATLGGHNPVVYPAAVLSSSANKADAAAFVQFLLSDEGRGILAKYGFSKP